MKRDEDALQKQIVQWLRLNGLFVAHVPNTARRSPREGARFKEMGMVAGYPDLIVHARGGVTVLIEVKAPAKRLQDGSASKAKPTISDAQTEVISTLAGLGFPVLIARDLDTVISALRNMGVVKGRGV